MEKYIVLGAGGHAKIVLDILEKCNKEIAGLTDATATGTCLGYPVLGEDAVLESLLSEGITCAAMGIGNVGNPVIRNKVYNYASGLGYEFPNVIHPSAAVSEHVRFEDGVVVAAGAVINPDAQIGSLAIINTGAVVEHEVVISRGAHIAPHATVLGAASVGENSFCGAGSVILPMVHVGNNVIIGAGAVVREDVPDNTVVAGVPGRVIRTR